MADPRYKALLIGNSRFPLDANLRALEGPVNDVVELRNALTNPQTGLFEPKAVRVLPERTQQEILVELQRFFDAASRDDILFLYYSGHGLLDSRNQLYLCAGDTRTDVLKATAVSNRQVTNMIDDSAAKTTIIVLDCCYSGAFKGTDLPGSLEGSGRFVLTSCRGSELANDTDQANHTSLFTQHVVDGLLQGAADGDQDGYVVLDELYNYVHKEIDTLRPRRPTPQRSFSGAGNVVIARRAKTSSPPVPQPVLDLSETLIELGELRPGELHPPRRVEVLNRGEGRLQWSAEPTADWLRVECHEGYFTVRFFPRPGRNSGEVVVRDRTTGVTKTVRVSAHVHEKVPPKLEVPETRVDFGRLLLGAVSPSRQVSVSNAGEGRLDARVTNPHAWLNTRQSGDHVILSIDTSTAGRFAGDLDIDSQGGTAKVHVTAVVEALPAAPRDPWIERHTQGPLTKPSRRAIALTSGALVLVLIVVLLLNRDGTVPSEDLSQPSFPPAATEVSDPAAPEFDAAGLRTAISNALREHVFLAASATGAALAGDTANFEAAHGALLDNSDAIAGLVGAVYGADLQSTFLGLWNSHIDMVVRYAQGIAAGDQAAADAAVAELQAYSQTLADVFEAVTEGGLPASASQPLILDHVLTLKSVIDKQHAGDQAGAFALRTAMDHMDMIAEPLAGAIATQHDIPGAVDSPAADLQAGLNGLLQEHVLLTGAATGNALAGNTAAFEATAGAIGANTDALATALGSVYGPDVEAAFKELWASHIGMVVDYTTGVATGDQAKIDDAVARSTAYVDTLAQALEQVTTLPASASQPLILAYVTTLRSVIDAQKAGDTTAAFTNLRAAAGHMHEIATPLAAAIAAQQGLV